MTTVNEDNNDKTKVRDELTRSVLLVRSFVPLDIHL